MTSSAPQTMAVSSEAYANAINRLRINFRVAIYTNLLGVAILLAAAGGATWLVLKDEFAAASVPVLLSVLDIAWGVIERPWRQLWLANNRIALSDSLWVAYLETKDAIEKSGMTGERQLTELLTGQDVWVLRMGAIAREDYEAAFVSLREISDRQNRVQSQLAVAPVAAVSYGIGAAPEEGSRLDAF